MLKAHMTDVRTRAAALSESIFVKGIRRPQGTLILLSDDDQSLNLNGP